MSRNLYAVRDTSTGFFINSAPAGHSGELFVSGLENAFLWDIPQPAQDLAASLSHSGRVCEVVEIQPFEGRQQ